LTADSFDAAIASGKTLVDFWAGWCMPCKMIAPILEELATEYKGKATIAKVDIDSESGLAARFGVMSIPTVILFEDGSEVKRFVGAQQKKAYESVLSP